MSGMNRYEMGFYVCDILNAHGLCDIIYAVIKEVLSMNYVLCMPLESRSDHVCLLMVCQIQ